MANLKNITELPLVDSIDGINLIANDNGAAKQIAANSVVGKVKTINGVEPDENGNVEIETASSWNDLKDKPFYVEPKIILERQVIDGFIPSGTEGYMVLLPYKIDYPDGVTLTVFWDGAEYNCISVNGFLGNAVAITGQPDDVPFVIWREAEGGTSAIIVLTSIAGDTNTSHEIGIVGETVHKIDPKYLPEVSGSGGYDAVIKFNTCGDDSELISGAYADILAKLRAGEWVNVAMYKPEDGYSVYIIRVKRVWYDQESYSIVIDFEDPYLNDKETIWLTSDNKMIGV